VSRGRGSGGGRRGASQRGSALDSSTVLPPGPVRTCVGCRGRAAKTDLLRVVADGGRLVPDPPAACLDAAPPCTAT
jgi:hypothetical protein